MSDAKLLTICPSRGRPAILARMLESFFATKSEGTDLVIYLNKDDAKLQEYLELSLEGTVGGELIVGERLFLAEACNHVFYKFPNYQYYQLVNDDHYYLTKEWDKKLIEVIETKGKGWGIACPEDLMTDWALWRHPSAEVISGNIPRALGYYIWPKIRHIGIDTCIGKLADKLGILFKVDDIVIEHRHWLKGKGFLDANYKFVYGNEEQEYGNRMIEEYAANQLDVDVEKITREMNR